MNNDNLVSARNPYFDNVKAILIILVVFGHVIEFFLHIQNIKFLYMLIYSFHMPLFIFCSGYFAKRDTNNIVKRLIIPYAIFQITYLIFDRHVLEVDNIYTFTTPYWILWYLFSCIFMNIILLFIKKVNIKIVIAAFVIGLLAGRDETIGYYFSLSRTLVYFPFFIFGFYLKDINFDFFKFKSSLYVRIFSIITAICGTVYLFINTNEITHTWFYGSLSYQYTYSNIFTRVKTYLLALIFSIFILVVIPKINIRSFTVIGVNCMTVFLLHGFIIKYLGKELPLGELNTNTKLWIYILFTTSILVIVLSNKYISKLLNTILPK